MKNLVFLLLLLTSVTVQAQLQSITGNLFDNEGNPLLYATAVLLDPADSTMLYYAISDMDGAFEIKNIKEGKYIFQISNMGFKSYIKQIEIPLDNSRLTIAMEPEQYNLSEVEINEMRAPFVIKKDTVEYNAGSFNVKPDAAAEELLKKLPGVQVDRSGNIKAQGESVDRVLVDGKEFFGSDPQVATKNLPADAIDKVQVYNKKSDETELTGIDDGTYSKTINMVLKDGKKSAVFGDLTAGIGTDDKYMASAKVYRFTKKHQFAAFAMVNNVNKYGFSFNDYLDFNGGIQSIMGGGGKITIGGESELPIDFGQNIDGLVTSGAAGANFTYEARKDNRFNISYLGSGANKDLDQSSVTNNYFDAGSYLKKDTLNNDTKNRSHKLNFGWRNKIDSTQNLIISGGVSFTTRSSKSLLNSISSTNGFDVNQLNNISENSADKYGGRVSATYLKKMYSKWKLLKLKGNLLVDYNHSNNNWVNKTMYFSPLDSNLYLGYQNNSNVLMDYSGSVSVTRNISGFWYAVPFVNVGGSHEDYQRLQGIPPPRESIIDSLSPEFTKIYNSQTAGLKISRNTKKSQLSFSIGAENSRLHSTLNNEETTMTSGVYAVPNVSWHYDYSSGRQLGIYYNSSVSAPTANQLLPVANNMNPLRISYGNNYLMPEYIHNLRFNWMLFDQFSLTSVFASVNGRYTVDKINFSREVGADLSEVLRLINVDHDYRADANIDFSTPIRRLGLDINLRVNETWNQGLSLVNGTENINTNIIHSFKISFNNRKNDKLDINVGASLTITDSKYSQQKSLNKVYYNTLAFTDIIYTPNDSWYFGFTADLSRYDDNSFGNSIYIPLLRAEITRYILKNNRGVISLELFDILDKNKGVQRISEMNYLMEKQSNSIGRYAMLSFKYRLNKFDKKSGITLDIEKR